MKVKIESFFPIEIEFRDGKCYIRDIGGEIWEVRTKITNVSIDETMVEKIIENKMDFWEVARNYTLLAQEQD